MLEIYRHTNEVTVWLDFDSNPTREKFSDADIKTLFGKLRRCSNGGRYDVRSTLQNLSRKQADPFDTLLRLPWWQRTWIIQEVASNKNVVVQCRHQTISWG